MCCTKQFLVLNSIYSGQVLSYTKDNWYRLLRSIKQVPLNKLSLVLKIDLQITQTLQLNKWIFFTKVIRDQAKSLELDGQSV